MDDTALTTTDNSLTAKQELFVDYFVGESRGNATDAARRAGYDGTAASLRRIGSQNLRKPPIHAAIRERLDELGATQGEVLAELRSVAFMSLDACVGGVVNGKGEIIGACMDARAKMQALEMLAKFHGLLTDKIEHSGTVETPVRQIFVHTTGPQTITP